MPGDFEKWWEQLQILLDAEGCELDLKSPEDLARLIIMKPVEFEKGSFDTQVTFAMDRNQVPLNLKQEDDEYEYDGRVFINAQGNGEPSSKDLKRIYEAAKQGHLFVAPLATADTPRFYRSLAVGESDSPVLHEDFEHLEPEDKIDFDALSVPDKPVKPGGPGLGTRILALFGNAAAKERLTAYHTSRQEYSRDLSEYNTARENAARVAEEKPWLLEYYNAINGSVRNAENRVGLMKYQAKLNELHRDSLLKDYHIKERPLYADKLDKEERLKNIGRQLGEVRGGTLAAGLPLGMTEKKLLAEALINCNEIHRVNRLIENKTFSGFRAKTPVEIAQEMERVCNDPNFGIMLRDIDGTMLFPMADKQIGSLDAYEAICEIGKKCRENFKVQKAKIAGTGQKVMLERDPEAVKQKTAAETMLSI